MLLALVMMVVYPNYFLHTIFYNLIPDQLVGKIK